MHKAVIIVAAALALSACGSVPAARGFVQSHTQCPIPVVTSQAWSADGKAIYYTLQPGTNAPHDLRKVSSDGATDTVIIHNAANALFSPDKSKALIFRNGPRGSPSTTFVAALDTGVERKLSISSFYPVWSPDSRWLAWVDIFAGSLYITDANTGETRQVVAQIPGYGTDILVWSPDSKSIALGFDGQNNRPGIYRVAAADGRVTRLTDPRDLGCARIAGPGSDVPEGWTPGGEALVYGHLCSYDTSLHFVTPDGLPAQGWSSFPAQAWLPEWSPDGAQAVFTMSGTQGSDLYVSQADGSKPQLIRRGVRAPSWSPDGTQIAFIVDSPSGGSDLFTINADGTDERQITHYSNAGRVCLH